MFDHSPARYPEQLDNILKATRAHGFSLASEIETGSILRTLATSKPAGRFLELGTGTGVGTSWILDGMDDQSRLVSVDRDETNSGIARRYLESDARVRFITTEGADFLNNVPSGAYDFIFADMYPGKFHLLDRALHSLAVGGLYIVDDLLPQPGWPDDHQQRVQTLISTLEQNKDLHVTKLHWASGLLIAARIK